MITYLNTSLFSSPAQTLVNTVNTVGVMGKGIAKQFKDRYPEMYTEYRKLCDEKKLSTGQLHLWRGANAWVLNFPTKTTWRKPSELSYVEDGLKKFVECYESLGISSVSFPPLGCGNGNLDWDEVRPMMEHYLKRVNIPVFIHNVHVPNDYVAEHHNLELPEDFEDFCSHLRTIVGNAGDQFATGSGRTFVALTNPDCSLLVRFEDGKSETLSEDMLQEAYVRMINSVLQNSSFGGERERKLKSYLFPILSRLPYVTVAKASTEDQKHNGTTALFVDRRSWGELHNPRGENQGCLFQ